MAERNARRGRPRLTDEQRSEQRSRLLSGAMDSIRRHGAEVSVDEIAAGTGVSKPVLYGHFGDRLGLADAIAVEMADQVTEVATEALASNEGAHGAVDFRLAVEVIVTALVDLVENEPEIYGFLVRAIRNGEHGFFDNALVDVIRVRGGALVEIANPGITPEAREVLVDGAYGFLLFAIESWKQRSSPGREELIATLTDAVVVGFSAASGRNALANE